MLYTKNVKYFILIAIIFLIGVFAVLKNSPPNNPPKITLIPTPTPVQALESDVHSPDGTMKVIMRKENKSGSLTSYSFFTAEISGQNEKLIFTKTLSKENAMTIPPNSFSPDNKYVFLEESGETFVNALVFKVSGEQFSENEQYRNINLLLGENKPEYFLKNVTGWASPTLVQIYIGKDISSRPSSFWFAPETKAFMGPVI